VDAAEMRPRTRFAPLKETKAATATKRDDQRLPYA
jgi:hypothetical protein